MRDYAKYTDVLELKALWLCSFGGTEDDADFYYQNRFRPEDTLLWREDGRIVSMMTLMRVWQDGEPGYYVFAVATHPDYRGRGLMRELDRWAVEVIKERGGRFSCLVPANEGLFAMYEKLGYAANFPVRVITLEGRGDARFALTDCSFPAFYELRKAYLSKMEASVCHPKDELQYVYRELMQAGDYVVYFTEHGRDCYAVYSVKENGILLRETSATDAKAVARGIMARHGRELALIRRPALDDGEGVTVPYGMGRRLDGKENRIGYMMLMLDD